MFSLVLSAMLSAAPVVAVGDVESTGLDPQLVAAWMERFSQLLANGQRVRVVTRSDLAQLLGLERQRQLMGCDASSCMTELAAGLGAEGLLRGSIARAGKSLTLSLKLLRTRDGTTWLSATERVSSDDAAQEWLDATARAFSEALAPAPSTPASTSPVVRWIPAMFGAAAGAGAAVSLAIASANRATLLSSPELTPEAIVSLKSTGQTAEWIGVPLASVAGAAVLTSIIWAASTPTKTSLTLVASPTAVLVGVGGTY